MGFGQLWKPLHSMRRKQSPEPSKAKIKRFVSASDGLPKTVHLKITLSMYFRWIFWNPFCGYFWLFLLPLGPKVDPWAAQDRPTNRKRVVHRVTGSVSGPPRTRPTPQQRPGSHSHRFRTNVRWIWDSFSEDVRPQATYVLYILERVFAPGPSECADRFRTIPPCQNEPKKKTIYKE